MSKSHEPTEKAEKNGKVKQTSMAEAADDVDRRLFKIEEWKNAIPIEGGAALNSHVPEFDDRPNVPLNQEHKMIIKETWALLHDHLTEMGTNVFLRIFELHPKIKPLFHFKDSTDAAEIVQDQRLLLHSTRFMEAIGGAVDHLDELDKFVAPVFINLGRRHIYFGGLKDNYFDVFCGCMMYVWREDLKDNFTPPVRQAWSRLFDFMLQHLKLGYQAAIKENANTK